MRTSEVPGLLRNERMTRRLRLNERKCHPIMDSLPKRRPNDS